MWYVHTFQLYSILLYAYDSISISTNYIIILYIHICTCLCCIRGKGFKFKQFFSREFGRNSHVTIHPRGKRNSQRLVVRGTFAGNDDKHIFWGWWFLIIVVIVWRKSLCQLKSHVFIEKKVDRFWTSCRWRFRPIWTTSVKIWTLTQIRSKITDDSIHQPSQYHLLVTFIHLWLFKSLFFIFDPNLPNKSIGSLFCWN